MTTLKRFGAFAMVIAGFAVASSASAAVTNVSVDADVTAAPIMVKTTSTTTTTVVNGTVNAGVTSDAMISIGRSDISSDDSVNVSASSVNSASMLNVYLRSVLKSDANVSKVEAQNDEVTLSYREHGKFLGFIPVTMSAKAVVKADGSVAVKYPWYSFLTAKSDTTLQSDLDASAGSMARAEGTATFSTNAKARLINSMRAVMKSHYDAQVSAAAAASASAN